MGTQQVNRASIDTSFRFCLYCLRAQWDAQGLTHIEPLLPFAQENWEWQLRMFDSHGIAAAVDVVNTRLKLFNAQATDDLRQVVGQHRQRNIYRLLLFRMAYDALAQAGVSFIVLKGAALLATQYAGIAFRQFGDIDILIEHRDLTVVMETLTQIGFIPEQEHLYDSQTAHRDIRVNMIKRAEGGEFHLEVHWDLFDRHFYPNTPYAEWCRSTMVPAQLAGMDILVLNPIAQFLHLCGHRFIHHPDSGLLKLRDIAEMIAFQSTCMDWDEVIRRAQEFELVIPLQRAFERLEQDDWGVPLPEEMVARILAVSPSRRERLRMARNDARWAGGAGKRFIIDLISLSTWRERVRFCWRGLFPASSYMTDRYQIRHRRLLPLYYLYRWGKGVRTLVKRA